MKKLTTQQAIERATRLGQYEGEGKIVSSHELEAQLEKTAKDVFIAKTGIPSLDRILEDTEAGELIVVTGPSGEGKTTLLMTITNNMALKEINTLWFTLEVTPRQFIKKIKSGVKKLPLFYLPDENIDNHLEWIEEKIIEAQMKHNTRIVFIDHIQQIFSLARVQQNISLEIGDLVGKIKQIAIDLNLVIFLIAHSKDDPQGTNREPRKEDIRDSGLIVRLADTVIGVWRIPNTDDGARTRRGDLNETDNKAKVRVFKNRRTGILGWFTMYHENHYLTESSEIPDNF